ncbi:tellurite resistance protein TehB [Vibrio ruber DSM 16370]|uniref:Tellurite resistance protein TehB n=1 Tax=Vibrio ruber (strain DSM 16370 / JCM 11486 / BCRC 17186 / CECT 7878 / LMG 23124 / VR1) TaxID=1123498 RepID=A0A1R4LEQ5_VIBR1|nr:class I SAM-dependent methyltransferase [Vibrio ruber]SJN55036.1 tellurite resistance protein TehB [Vibrio ruber DSM 16370]
MWDDRYQVDTYIYGKEPNDFLRESVQHQYLPLGAVLCLADGEGRNSVYLAKCGYDVTAVDLSAVAIEKARLFAAENHVSVNFIQADLNDFDLGLAQWQAVVAVFCHLPPVVRQKLHQSLPKSLKTSGVYLVEGYTPEQLKYKTGGPSEAEMMLSRQVLIHELPTLSPWYIEEKEREIYEGVMHRGKSHVVQAIMKKNMV